MREGRDFSQEKDKYNERNLWRSYVSALKKYSTQRFKTLKYIPDLG